MARYHEMAASSDRGQRGTLAKFIGDGAWRCSASARSARTTPRAVRTGSRSSHLAPLGDRIAQRHGVEVGCASASTPATGARRPRRRHRRRRGQHRRPTRGRVRAGRVLVGEDTWRLTRSAVSTRCSARCRSRASRTRRHVPGRRRDQRRRRDAHPVRRSRPRGRSAPSRVRAGRRGKLRATGDGDRCPGVGKTRLARELGAAVGDSGGSSRCAASAPAPPRSRR